MGLAAVPKLMAGPKDEFFPAINHYNA